MKKYALLLLIPLALIVIIIGSSFMSDKEVDINKSIAYIKNLKSYKANMKVTVLNQRQNIEYDIEEIFVKDKGTYVKINDNREMWYVEDRVIANDLENNKDYERKNNEEDMLQLIFAHEYIKRLYTNEKIDYSFKEEGNKKNLLIKFQIFDQNLNLERAELTINSSTGVPEKIEIYDKQDEKSIVCTYEKFMGDFKEIEGIFEIKENTNE